MADDLRVPERTPAPGRPGPDMIRIEHVSKRFALRHARALKELVFAAMQRKKLAETFLALDDVDLSIRAGETVGLIGFNGSVTSSLLKTICGVVSRARGSVLLRGRVAVLIESGAALHVDLSGRENVCLHGAILRMSREQMDAKFDDIVAFSEI